MAKAPAAKKTAPAVEAPAIAGDQRGKHSATVTVASKLPFSLSLQLQEPAERLVPTGRGGEDQLIREFRKGGEIFIVRGNAVPAMGGVPDGYKMPRLENGVALTEGIPRKFWETWLKQNRLAEYVTSGMIFAYGEESNVIAQARDFEKQTSGLDPISREADAQGRMMDRRIPKPLTSSIARVSQDVERTEERGNG